MCRLFGLLGGPLTPAEPWLISTDRSLLRQSNATPETTQHDGWGIAWYGSTRVPRAEKGGAGAYEPGERERFVATARRAKGPVVLGHLREASNPMGLSHEHLIGLENSQPFLGDGTMYAHNGMIPFPRETRALLGPLEERIRGVNDSEVLFWLIEKQLQTSGDPLVAYGEAVEALIRVWKAKGRPKGGPYSGLNVLYTRGPNELWAFCHWNGEHGPSFFDPTRPYYQMAYTADAKQLIVGSEPFDSDRSDWRPLVNGSFLHAQVAAGLVGVETGPIPALARLVMARPAR